MEGEAWKEMETQRYTDKWRQRGREVTKHQGHSWKEEQDKPETNKQNTNSLLPRLSSGARK